MGKTQQMAAQAAIGRGSRAGKGHTLIYRKIVNKTVDSALKLKVTRFLISRGFPHNIISKALKGVMSEKSSS